MGVFNVLWLASRMQNDEIEKINSKFHFHFLQLNKDMFINVI